ncbi:putative F-box/LRR-repeat protein 23 [Rutidosis leptorrhynchoides]|uniref:putative F-box/LRR-repeat protein 23 n=1 Tax=Rutidosis leptorrhynchoides TaxID=125765 RepID=UPI003A98F6FF
MAASTTNWFDLTVYLKSNILCRVSVPDVLENAQKVCTDWFKICKQPSMWKVLNLDNSMLNNADSARCLKMSKHAVDRSQGQLVDITFPKFKTKENDEFLLYVADRASQLKRLTMSCSSWGYGLKRLPEALKKFPLLEELTLYSVIVFTQIIESLARYCPLLKTLTVDHEPHGSWNTQVPLYDGLAISIGENLHDLRHLTLLANGVSDIGLQVILDGCPHLESLDLTMCWNINLKGDVVKKCKEQIKCLLLPNRNVRTKKYDNDLVHYDYGLFDSFESYYTDYYSL